MLVLNDIYHIFGDIVVLILEFWGQSEGETGGGGKGEMLGAGGGHWVDVGGI